MIRAIQVVFITAIFSLLFTGCYRTPCEDDYCIIPSTNNPNITRHVESFQTGVGY